MQHAAVEDVERPVAGVRLKELAVLDNFFGGFKVDLDFGEPRVCAAFDC